MSTSSSASTSDKNASGGSESQHLSEIESYINDLHLLNNSDNDKTLLSKIPVATKVEICLGFIKESASAYQQHNCRQPNIIFRLASNLIVHHKSQMSSAELYAIYEIGVQAALDLGHDNVATEWIVVLKHRFGKCPRVFRLVGLLEEAQGETAKALDHYERCKNDFPNETWPIKRIAALHKGKGKYAEAISTLEVKNVYHDKVDEKSYPFRQLHPLDDGSLKELINLHWLNDAAEKAIYYAEELLLLDPHNFLFMSRLGELCYAAGQYERAISSYAQSIRLNPHVSNARAGLGLWQSCLEWRSKNKNGGNNGKLIVAAAATTKNVDDIDDESDNNNNNNNKNSSSNNSASSGTSSSSAGTGMTLALCNELISVSEAKLKECYQNSPLCSVLELTLRRYS